MQITIDDAQQFIVSTIKELKKQNRMHQNPMAWGGYDIYLNYVIPLYLGRQRSLTNKAISAQELDVFFIPFAEAAWELCRKGFLRLGKSQLSGSGVQEVGVGFTITSFGHRWLERDDINDFLPANPDRFVQTFDAFQPLFGRSYFRRAKEAVHCFHTGSSLACCAMSGAAMESILLSAAFKIKNQPDVLKEYFSSRGRSKVENIVFGKADAYIKDRYQKYTDIISYWRDESGHGHESDIDQHEPYISLLTLLRFAEFMRDHWDVLTGAVAVTP